MKIRRWAIYDSHIKQYYPRRFVFKQNAENKRNAVILNLLFTESEPMIVDLFERIQVVELL